MAARGVMMPAEAEAEEDEEEGGWVFWGEGEVGGLLLPPRAGAGSRFSAAAPGWRALTGVGMPPANRRLPWVRNALERVRILRADADADDRGGERTNRILLSVASCERLRGIKCAAGWPQISSCCKFVQARLRSGESRTRTKKEMGSEPQSERGDTERQGWRPGGRSHFIV